MAENPEVGKMKISFLQVSVIFSTALFSGSFLATHIFIFTNLQPPFEFKYTVQVALCLIIFTIALLNTETMYAKKLIKSY